MSDALPIDRRSILLTHLDSVYTLALAVTPDADRAAQLVEATYTQAFATLPSGGTEEDNKRRLLQLLMEIHHEQHPLTTQELETDPGGTEADAEVLHAFRRRLAEQYVARTLPGVFATLPETQRLLLLLCTADGLPCADAAVVLDLDTGTACRQFEQALTAVTNAMFEEASDRERQLLEANLPEDWLATALSNTVNTTFGPTPPTLRIAVETATEQNPPTAKEPERLPDPPRLTLPVATERMPVAERVTLGSRLKRAGLVVLIILAVSLIGYAVSLPSNDGPVETNLITLAVQQADATDPMFRTHNPEQAEEFIRGGLNWRLTLPSIDGATLLGASIQELTSEVSIPTFLYDDGFAESEQRITLFVFNYALLDRFADRIALEPGILRQIQEEQRFDLHDLGEQQVLIWRHRDDIYLAVTTDTAETLRERIIFPS